MDLLTILVSGGIGFLLGAGILYFLGKSSASAKESQIRAELSGQIASLQTTVEERTRRLGELGDEMARLQLQLVGIQGELQKEGEARASSEEKARQIPALEERLRVAETELQTHREESSAARSEKAILQTTLEEERKAAAEKMALVQDAETKLVSSFKILSAEALKGNNQAFVELAKATLEKYQEGAKSDLDKRQVAIDQMIKPVKESLDKVDGKIQQIEKDRVGAYEGLTQQVKSLMETQGKLHQVTGNLVQALGTPRVRGRWGEIQLKRVVELAGMVDHCDFFEQQSAASEDGQLRPDLVVRLPGGKNIIVDAKAPLAAYLEAIEEEDEGKRRILLQTHARHIRDHMKSLSRKSYWDQFKPTPEFVILFLPNETFFSAALQEDPALIEQGVEQRVILATPTTLITLLKAVSYGWRQEMLAENAREIAELGKELYKRVLDMSGHFADIGQRLGKSVESYNKAVGSLETRVLVTARKFRDLHVGTEQDELEVPIPIETSPRALSAPEAVNGKREELKLEEE